MPAKTHHRRVAEAIDLRLRQKRDNSVSFIDVIEAALEAESLMACPRCAAHRADDAAREKLEAEHYDRPSNRPM